MTDGDASSEPRVGDFDAAATADAFRTLSGIGRAYTLAVAQAPLDSPAPISPYTFILEMTSAVPGAASPRSESGSVPFQLLSRLPNPPSTLDLGAFELQQTTRPPAGFAGILPPLALQGARQFLRSSADFSLYPVWLPALFALAAPRGGLRAARGFDPHSIASPGGIGQFQL